MHKNKLEQPITLPIKRIEEENPRVKSFYFDIDLRARPGQFIMFWLPRVNLKPFGVSYQKNGETGITICRVGKTTEKILELKAGDVVGLQGPYGTSYNTKGYKNITLVAGGYGAAPLSFLTDESGDKNVDFIIGASCSDALLYSGRHKGANINTHLCTDDGSRGYKGFVTDKLGELLDKKNIDLVCACGPELMQEKVVEICGERKIDCQISLERYMKCGFGVCGQCVIDPLGIRMCKEGPVISAELCKKIFEFGKYHRDGTGKRHYF